MIKRVINPTGTHEEEWRHELSKVFGAYAAKLPLHNKGRLKVLKRITKDQSTNLNVPISYLSTVHYY